MDHVKPSYKPSYFVTFRHFRRESGGATAACVVRPCGNKKLDLVIGFSFCSPEETNFSRKVGRSKALDRLVKHPIILEGVVGIAQPIITYLKIFTDPYAAIHQLGVSVYDHVNDGVYCGNFIKWFPKFISEL